MDRIGEIQEKKKDELELDAIIAVSLWFSGCFCSRLDSCAYKNSCITLSRHFSHACQSIQLGAVFQLETSNVAEADSRSTE